VRGRGTASSIADGNEQAFNSTEKGGRGKGGKRGFYLSGNSKCQRSKKESFGAVSKKMYKT